MQRPLHGVRVIDLSNVLAGPFCTHQLAHMGADVIKVERPASGDLARQLGADAGLNRRYMGVSFLAQNPGKRSITIDLKSRAGKDLLRRLARRWMRSRTQAANSCRASGTATIRSIRARRIEAEIEAHKGRRVPLNIDGATAVIYAELGFAAALARGLFCLPRSVGILAHALEQTEQGGRNKGPLPRRHLWTYDGPPPRDTDELP